MELTSQVCFCFLLLLPAPAVTEVTSFQNCPQFFLQIQSNRIYPTRLPDQNRYKEICQMFGGVYEFATLYDTGHRIPVYSAYAFGNYLKTGRRNSWFIEPQLDDASAGPNMASANQNMANLGNSQALNDDYTNSVYDKGHLFPVLHADSQESSLATCTLTNAVPQHQHFNRGVWRQMESNVYDYSKTNCLQPVYIITGAVPGQNNTKNRVNIPENLWTAFCCQDRNSHQWISKAHFGPNDDSGTLNETSVSHLENTLKTHYHTQSFSLFGGNCNDIN
uniref:Zgc:158445 n=1 Tax=Lepisosteus oculatus TaxID=7918 RepID=W5LWM7_LEPOC